MNRMATLVLQNQSLFECLFNHTPDYDFLRTFMFLGYSSSHLGYRCLDFASQHIYVSCHVCFHESVFPFVASE